MHGEKEKSIEEKQVCSCSEGFFLRSLVIPLIWLDHLYIFAARMNQVEKRHAVDIFAAQRNREETKNKTVSVHCPVYW